MKSIGNNVKNYVFEKKQFQKRLVIAFVFFCVCLAILFIRLGYLQIFSYQAYTTLAKHNQIKLIPLLPKRGLIFDRNGILLAENKPTYHLVLKLNHVKDSYKILDKLKNMLILSSTDLKKWKSKILNGKKSFESLIIKKKLKEEEVSKIYANQYWLPGVEVGVDLIRYYPLGAVTSFPIGYMGKLEIENHRGLFYPWMKAAWKSGQLGIEKYYETKLRGTLGYKQVEVNATGHEVRLLKEIPAKKGDSIYLTLDSRLQQVASKALGSLEGSVVALVPETGEVLVLLSQPNFDPNTLTQGVSQRDFKSAYLFNRAIRGQFSPGSTVKPLIALKSLDEKVIKPETEIYDPGWFQLPHSQHIYHDMQAHGMVNLRKAIKVSCDTYFYELAFRLGIKHLDKLFKSFGFGSITHIDLPAESKGLVPSPAWKSLKYDQPWYLGDTIVVGIGQGYLLVTPIQLAVAAAMLANHGKPVIPYLYKPKKLSQKNLSTVNSKHWTSIISAMQAVIQEQHGTGYRFGRHPKYTVAAKTGTAQLYHLNKKNSDLTDENNPYHLRDNSLFIAFAPVENPKIAIAVVVEHAHDAPRIARAVFDAYLVNKTQKNKRLP